VALNTALVNVSAFLAPLLGTSLAAVLGIRIVFFITGALRLVGVGFFYRLYTENTSLE
jgi:hypothetical protein